MGWIKIQLKYLGFLKLFLFEYFIITHSGRRLYQYNEDESFIFNKLFSKYSYQEKLFYWKLRLTLCVYMPLLDKIKIKIRFNCIDIIAYNFIKPVILMCMSVPYHIRLCPIFKTPKYAHYTQKIYHFLQKKILLALLNMEFWINPIMIFFWELMFDIFLFNF